MPLRLNMTLVERNNYHLNPFITVKVVVKI